MQHSNMQSELLLVSTCLVELGYNQLAKKVKQENNWEFANDLIKVITREAQSRNDCEILDRLQFAGLIN